MARNHANSGRIYRAVIIRFFVNGRVVTRTYGPYDTPTPAKSLVTQARGAADASHGRYRNPAHAFTVAARIETAAVVWEEVSE